MPTEHVCQSYVGSHAGAPHACDCGHFSASFVTTTLDDNDESQWVKVCADCAASALREVARAGRAVVDLRMQLARLGAEMAVG